MTEEEKQIRERLVDVAGNRAQALILYLEADSDHDAEYRAAFEKLQAIEKELRAWLERLLEN